jgi:hypothetical protein
VGAVWVSAVPKRASPYLMRCAPRHAGWPSPPQGAG